MEESWKVALELAEGLPAGPVEIRRIADKTSVEAAHWAFAQWDLRKRAKAKFARADEMLFVREALEQATHETVAAYHASLFPQGKLVADLTSGIGSDLIAMVRRGPAAGYELDSERVNFARHNLAIHGLAAKVRLEDSTAAAWDFDYAFADPSRRVESRRTLDPSEFSPDPAELAVRFAELRLGVIKLSPLLSDAFLQSLGPRQEFISFGGECREALVICGREAADGQYAVHIESGSTLAESFPPSSTSSPGEYLFDSDPAAVRAHALGALCDEFGLSPLGSSNGYLTGSHDADSPWLKRYQVLYSGKGDVKSTRKALRERDAYVFEIKQRGAKADLVKLKREFSEPGKLPLSLVLWPEGHSIRHMLVARIAD